MQINGKLALVTGASSGIGAVTAQALAKKGASVILIARREDALQEVATAIEAAGGKAYVYPVDLNDSEAAVQAMQRIKDEVGLPDILVNNAGTGQWKATYETSPDELLFMTKLPNERVLSVYPTCKGFAYFIAESCDVVIDFGNVGSVEHDKIIQRFLHLLSHYYIDRVIFERFDTTSLRKEKSKIL